jgi:two-component system chemotaxis response regulator CheY
MREPFLIIMKQMETPPPDERGAGLEAGRNECTAHPGTLDAPMPSDDPKLLVLIVEDDQEIAGLIAAVVEHVGATPLVAYDGQQALELAQGRAPALLITDLILPGISGDTLITTLRTAWDAHLPAILVSAAPWVQRRAAGADAVLAKPFRVGDLLALLDRYLPT